jgi:hypothetical protein
MLLCLLLASAGARMSAVHEVVAAEPPKSKPQQLPGMTPPLLPETLHPKSMRDYQPKLTPEEHPASRGVIVRVEIIVPCHLDHNVPSEHFLHIVSLTHYRLRLLNRWTRERELGTRILEYQNFIELPVGRYRVDEFAGPIEVRDWSAREPAYTSTPACHQRRRSGPPPPPTTFFSHLNALEFEVTPRTVAVDLTGMLGPQLPEVRFDVVDPSEKCPMPPCM